MPPAGGPRQWAPIAPWRPLGLSTCLRLHQPPGRQGWNGPSRLVLHQLATVAGLATSTRRPSRRQFLRMALLRPKSKRTAARASELQRWGSARPDLSARCNAASRAVRARRTSPAGLLAAGPSTSLRFLGTIRPDGAVCRMVSSGPAPRLMEMSGRARRRVLPCPRCLGLGSPASWVGYLPLWVVWSRGVAGMTPWHRLPALRRMGRLGPLSKSSRTAGRAGPPRADPGCL